MDVLHRSPLLWVPCGLRVTKVQNFGLLCGRLKYLHNVIKRCQSIKTTPTTCYVAMYSSRSLRCPAGRRCTASSLYHTHVDLA